MKIEMDTIHPAQTKVYLTYDEVLRLYQGLLPNDTNIILGYEDNDYGKPYADYGDKRGIRRTPIWKEV